MNRFEDSPALTAPYPSFFTIYHRHLYYHSFITILCILCVYVIIIWYNWYYFFVCSCKTCKTCKTSWHRTAPAPDTFPHESQPLLEPLEAMTWNPSGSRVAAEWQPSGSRVPTELNFLLNWVMAVMAEKNAENRWKTEWIWVNPPPVKHSQKMSKD